MVGVLEANAVLTECPYLSADRVITIRACSDRREASADEEPSMLSCGTDAAAIVTGDSAVSADPAGEAVAAGDGVAGTALALNIAWVGAGVTASVNDSDDERRCSETEAFRANKNARTMRTAKAIKTQILFLKDEVISFPARCDDLSVPFVAVWSLRSRKLSGRLFPERSSAAPIPLTIRST